MMAEFALLKRPMVFFAYDLDNYVNNERDFYINFEEDVPGKVVFDMDSLIKVFKENDFGNLFVQTDNLVNVLQEVMPQCRLSKTQWKMILKKDT